MVFFVPGLCFLFLFFVGFFGHVLVKNIEQAAALERFFENGFRGDESFLGL